MPDEIYFFGGTAINRTHISSGRLSEDIGLIAIDSLKDVLRQITPVVEDDLRRSHGRVSWSPDFAVADVIPAAAVTPDGVAVKIQVLSRSGYPNWPNEFREISQHFPSVKAARLRVSTLPAAIAWKTVAWPDRRTSRDLYDLYSLAAQNVYPQQAANLFSKLGPTGKPPARWMFETKPRDDWRTSLASQTVLGVTAPEA